MPSLAKMPAPSKAIPVMLRLRGGEALCDVLSRLLSENLFAASEKIVASFNVTPSKWRWQNPKYEGMEPTRKWEPSNQDQELGVSGGGAASHPHSKLFLEVGPWSSGPL